MWRFRLFFVCLRFVGRGSFVGGSVGGLGLGVLLSKMVGGGLVDLGCTLKDL